MNRIIILLAATLPFAPALAADATVECPFDNRIYANGMQSRVVYTQRAGYAEDVDTNADTDETEVSITLKHVLDPVWTCATWEVELLLPEGVAIKSGTATTRTGLTHGSVATFQVALTEKYTRDRGYRWRGMTYGEIHEYRGAFAVRAFNSQDAAVAYPDVTDGMGRFHYPVVFQLVR